MVKSMEVFVISYDRGESEVFISPDRERVILRQRKGRALRVREFVYILGTSRELVRALESIEEGPYDYTATCVYRTSGARDIFLRSLGKYRSAQIHTSMYQKLNEGLDIPRKALVSVYSVLRDLFGYDKIWYSIRKEEIAVYDNVYIGIVEAEEKCEDEI
mgnify:FL=1